MFLCEAMNYYSVNETCHKAVAPDLWMDIYIYLILHIIPRQWFRPKLAFLIIRVGMSVCVCVLAIMIKMAGSQIRIEETNISV